MTPAEEEAVETDLGPPYTFCDRACERCVLAETCSVWHMTREIERKLAAQPSGVPPAGLGQMESSLRSLVASADGLTPSSDADGSPRLPPPSLLAARLGRAAMDHSLALRDLLESPAAYRVSVLPGRQAAIDIILHAAFLIPGKVARLSSYLREDGIAGFVPRMVGNATATFALLERVEADLQDALQRLGVHRGPAVEALRRVHARLWRLLLPLQATLPPEPRTKLEALIARRQAPSPFCVIRPGSH